MGEPLYNHYPDLSLAQAVFTLASPSTSPSNKRAALTTLQDAIKEHKMAPLYHYLAHPLSGKLNSAGEGGTSSAKSLKGPPVLRRTSSINSSSIIGVLGGIKAGDVDLPWDEHLYEELKRENDKELEVIQKEEDEAVESAGETEIQSARGKRAELYTRIGDKDAALAAYEALLEKTGILGTKIDIVLAIIRIGLFFDDKILVKKSVDRASTLVESGGDWDRRNRLKAYTGLHYLTIRSYPAAYIDEVIVAPLLLDSLSTFTSTELCPYSSLVIYAVLAGSVSLPRREFKSRVVDAPEVRAILGSDSDNERLAALSGVVSSGPSAGDEEMQVDQPSATSATPNSAIVNLTTLGSSSSAAVKSEPTVDFKPLASLIQSLYTGQYNTFFSALAAVETQFLSQDRYLYEHKGWFVREMRLRAYAQLLQSYKVVSLESMASSFGVSVDWLDRYVLTSTTYTPVAGGCKLIVHRDLAPFIASQRLPCTIDRVKGVIETQRAGDKNRQ
ncbi:proteasome regulatory particle subunit [Elasticomyces elasticus]|nr:proteasome regulatory particle subunit [Elasticomyces elasticus]